MLRRAKRYAANSLARLNRLIRDYDEKVWIVGDGRSGTNWLSSILNHDGKSRFMYEPIHPAKIETMKSLQLFHYQRASQRDENLQKMLIPIWDGTHPDYRINYANRLRLYSRILVKDIFGHLLARWAVNQFPEIKPILIMRHPFDVAASKAQKQDWTWMTEPTEFLKRPHLLEDHLEEFSPQVERAETFFEKQITIWAIIHYVWFRQFKQDECEVIFYEDLCIAPATKLERLGQFIGRGESDIHTMIEFAVSSARPVPEEAKMEELWPQFTRKELEFGLDVLSAFGLSLYGPQRRPLVDSSNAFAGGTN